MVFYRTKRKGEKVSSCYSPRWKRFLQKYLKFLFIVCPEGNYHWRWHRFCFCCDANECPVYVYYRGRWAKIGERWNWEVR